mgnify:CR=1 FL=1
MIEITQEEAKIKIEESKGKFYRVTFIKANGELRVLNGRQGVYNSKNTPLKGVGLPYNPKDYNLINAFDVQIEDYRMIKVGRIQELAIDNKIYNVVGGK